MRGRVITVLLVLTFLSQTAAAACSWVSRYSGQFRSTAYDVAVDSEGFVWVASGYGVQLLAPAATGALVFTDGAAIPGSTRVITVAGNIGYAGSGSRVYILRRNGRTLDVIRSIDAGATVNDITAASYLFVATSNGIAHFDLFDPTLPVRTSVVLTTSLPNVTSLAILGSRMYAADGDATIEVFTLSIPAFPQGTGVLESFASSTAVHATTNNLIFVSDDLGQNTDIFSPGSTTRLARIAYGSNAFAPLTGDSFFAAGPQRVIQGLDISTLTRVAEIFEQQLLPLGGTSNRIFAMARGGNMLYVAAGDMGLFAYDVASLAAPHPLISYADGAKSSAIAIGDKAYFADTAGISELSINRSGISMTPVRSWTTTSPVLHDSTATTLLTSSNTDLKLWSVEAATPTVTFSVTLATNVRSAVLAGNTAIALLADDSLWRVPLEGGAPQKLTIEGGAVLSIARSGNAVAIAQITNDGKTIAGYYANGDLAAATKTFTVDGIALGGLALSSTTAAVFTFRGITLIDLAGGTTRVLAGSNALIPQQLLFSGSDLLVLGERSSVLAVWDTSKDQLLREHALPESPSRMHVSSGIAIIASGAGTMAIDYKAALPKSVPAISNRFYRKAAAAGDYLYLFEEGRIDILWTAKGAAPHFVTSIGAPGTNDIAALPQTLFALGAFGTVTSYSTAGVQLAQVSIAEAADAQQTAIVAAGNAVWISFVKGCSSGTCERKTLVLDPKTLAVTATINGGAAKVVTSGTRAYALFQLPDEIRILDITNPLQPSQIIAAPSPALASDIAYAAGKVYVVAGKVYGYNESLLAAGDFLDSVSATQSMALDGDCAVISGRHENPDFFTLPSWSPVSSSIEMPSPVRMLAAQPGRIFLLTDHSIEVWSTAPPPPPVRRRSAR